MRRTILLLLCLLIPVNALAVRQIDLSDTLPAGRPIALEVDDGGRIFVPQENGSIRVLTSSGEVVMTLGGKDFSGQPLFKKPSGIAFGAERIYVADRELNRIAIFDKDGILQGTFGGDGSKPKQFDEPRGLIFSRGLLFVADSDNDRIQVFGPNGVYISAFGQGGAKDAQLSEPTELAVDGQGQLLILDDSGAIKIFSLAGEYQGKLPLSREATCLAADREGIWLTDRKSMQICKIDDKGKELFCFGSRGKDRGQFLSFDGLAVRPSGEIFVADREKGVVQFYKTEGTGELAPLDRLPPVTTVRWQGELRGAGFKQLAVAPNGRIYGIPAEEKSVLIYNGTSLDRIVRLPGWDPVALTVAGDGALWVIDGKQEKVLKLDDNGKISLSFGSSGSREGQFDEPSSLALSSKGTIYVADRENSRVQVFSPSGTFLSVLGGGVKSLFESPTQLVVDGKDQLWVLDGETQKISVFAPDGQKLFIFGGRGESAATFRGATSLAVTPNEVLVLDGESGVIKAFSPKGELLRQFGTAGRALGDFSAAAALAVASDTEILVADPAGNRVQTFAVIYTAATPGGLVAQAGQRQVALRWDKNSESYVTSYRLYRSEAADGGFRPLGELTANSYFDRDVLPGKTYYYRLTALARAGNESGATAVVQAVPTKIVPPTPEQFTAVTQEWSAELSWKIPTDSTAAEFRVYRMINGKSTLISKTREPTYNDIDLEAEHTYQYAVTAVSIDDVESPPVPLKVTTQIATRPPLEIEVVHMDDIFSNTYKIYETEGLGRLRLVNNTRDQLSRVKLALTIKGFMDYPSEVVLEKIAGRSSEEIDLKVVFNNQILNVTEDSPVQAELTATYFKGQEQKTFSKIHTIRVFEKHRMIWEERGRYSAFVTPKDPIILEFTRSIASQFSEFADPLIFAGMTFDALGTFGVGYLQDPSNPYQVTSGKTDYVDYIQYPRETLSRKSGDCDDLVGIYSSMLESLGIRTKVVEIPGHMFMMFSTGQEPGSIIESLRDLYVSHEGTLWIPVEVTLVGSPFMKAWEIGVRNYREWEKNGLTHLDIRSAWERYKPASLPMSDWRPPEITRATITEHYRDDLPTLRRIRVQNLGQPFLARLKDNPNDGQALLQLAITYSKAGELGEALLILEKAKTIVSDNAGVFNGLGNIYFLTDRYNDAEAAYFEAVRIDPADPYVWVNLARTQLRLEKRQEAAEAFKQALALKPEIGAQYKSLAITLGTPY